MDRRVVLCALAFGLALAASPSAQAQRPADRYTFKAGKAGEETRLELVINRYSSTAERDMVFNAARQDVSKIMGALENPGVVGWIHLPGGLDHTIRYARRVTRPDGSTDVIVLAEGPAWIWWHPVNVDNSKRYGFTVIQLRLDRMGSGEGKLSAMSVAADQDAGVILADFAKEPALLTEVRREASAS